MKRVEFRLTMPGCASWNGRWSGEGKDYTIVRKLTEKSIKFLGLDEKPTQSWSHCWDDGWRAQITARVMEKGERAKKYIGFSGYDWMVNNIIWYGSTRGKE